MFYICKNKILLKSTVTKRNPNKELKSKGKNKLTSKIESEAQKQGTDWQL